MLSSPHQNDRDICTNGKGACEIHRLTRDTARKRCLTKINDLKDRFAFNNSCDFFFKDLSFSFHIIYSFRI